MDSASGESPWRERRCAGGLHLFHRGSGLNVLLDEVTFPTAELALAPRYVSIALTNACDLKCAHCYAPKHAARLNAETLKGWLRELDENGCLGVGFGGGEPTLHPHFAMLCRFTAQATGLAVTFTTHAHHLSDKLLDELRRDVHFIRVSMDGVGSTYEEVRGRPFLKLLSRLRAIGHHSIRFGINFVVNARTVTDLDAAVACAADVGATELLLLPEQATGIRPGSDPETNGRLSAWIETYSGSVPLVVGESATPSLPFLTPVPGETGSRAYVHVDAAGILKASSFDHDGVPIINEGVIAAFTHLQRQSQMRNV